MEEIEVTLKQLLLKYRLIISERDIFLIKKNDPEYAIEEAEGQRLATLERLIAMLDCCLALLSDDEKFVVETHLIKGCDWIRVVDEYKKSRGIECEKTERTLKSYQKRALEKMTLLVLKNGKYYREIYNVYIM